MSTRARSGTRCVTTTTTTKIKTTTNKQRSLKQFKAFRKKNSKKKTRFWNKKQNNKNEIRTRIGRGKILLRHDLYNFNQNKLKKVIKNKKSSNWYSKKYKLSIKNQANFEKIQSNLKRVNTSNNINEETLKIFNILGGKNNKRLMNTIKQIKEMDNNLRNKIMYKNDKCFIKKCNNKCNIYEFQQSNDVYICSFHQNKIADLIKNNDINLINNLKQYKNLYKFKEENQEKFNDFNLDNNEMLIKKLLNELSESFKQKLRIIPPKNDQISNGWYFHVLYSSILEILSIADNTYACTVNNKINNIENDILSMMKTNMNKCKDALIKIRYAFNPWWGLAATVAGAIAATAKMAAAACTAIAATVGSQIVASAVAVGVARVVGGGVASGVASGVACADAGGKMSGRASGGGRAKLFGFIPIGSAKAGGSTNAKVTGSAVGHAVGSAVGHAVGNAAGNAVVAAKGYVGLSSGAAMAAWTNAAATCGTVASIATGVAVAAAVCGIGYGIYRHYKKENS